jgi:hypothetical protein
MRKIELICGIVATISIVFKYIIGSSLNTIFIISVIGLSMFYTYFSFLYFNNIPINKAFKKESYNGLSKLRILGTIGLGFGLAFTILGILWSLMYWPFNTYFKLGIPILLIIGTIALIKYSVTKSKDYLRILNRILIIGGFGFILWVTPQETINEMLGIESNQIEQLN